jgi:hypothetical protein
MLDNKQGTYMLLDAGDRNVINKAAEKVLKYKDVIA